MLLKSKGVFDDKVSVIKLANDNKELVFIPMHHIGKQAFYDDVKYHIDSLRRVGYIVYYELVTLPPAFDSLTKDTLVRKFRKIVGNLSANGYISKDSLLFGKKYKFLKELVNQPKDKTIGLDTSADSNVDVFLHDLIKAYEDKYSKVILQQCDFDTGLKDIYQCEKIKNKEARNFLLKEYRDEMIAERIMNSTDKKIILMYGENHYRGIFDNLRKIDLGWREN